MEFIVFYIIFYVLISPLTVLLHEIGHALGVIFITRHNAIVYLGPSDDSNKENFQIGRIHFHINWSFIGFCNVKNRKEEFNTFQRIVISAGGPFISLLIAIISFISSFAEFDNSIKNFLIIVAILNFYQFVVTAIPIVYPSWWFKAYSGMPSDGYRIMKAIRKGDI